MLRVVVVGTGSIGERHLRCFQSTGRVQTSFVEVNPALRETIAARYGVERAYADLDAALDDPHDMAVICTPAPLHVPQARTLADAGLHLLIEKPLSTSLDGIADLERLIAARGLTVGIAYVYRCHPLLQAARAALADGRWGRPVEIVATSGQHFPTYRPAYRQIYYTSRAQGGGAIQDALTHVINAGQWLVGRVDRVLADAAHQVLEGVEVEDTVHVLTRHGAVMGSYSLNQHQAPNEFTLTVVAERGTLRCEFHKHRWRWMTQPGGDWHDEAIAPLERDTLFVAQAHAFLDAVERRQPPPCTLADGLATLQVNLAALRSLDSGRWESTN